MGYNLRQLIFDGAPSKNLHTADIVNHWELGYQSFNDREKFRLHYIESDFLSPGDKLLQLREKIDIIYVAHILHQWNLETRLAAAIQLILLTRVWKSYHWVLGWRFNNKGRRSDWDQVSSRVTDAGILEEDVGIGWGAGGNFAGNSGQS